MKNFDYNGIHFNSISEACKYYNINQGYLSRIIKDNNITVQEALDHFLGIKILKKENTYRSKPFDYNGIHFKSRKTACIYYNIDQGYLSRIIKKYNVTIQEALDHCIYHHKIPNSKNKSFDYNGIHFYSRNAAYKYYNINPSSLINIIKNNSITIQEALDIAISKNNKNK